MSVELPIDPSGRDGPERKADVIVSETLDSGCIGEGVLHSARFAARTRTHAFSAATQPRLS